MKKILLSALTAATLTAASAQASTIEVSNLHPNIFKDENGQNAWYLKTKFEVDGVQSGRVAAGAFRLEGEFESGAIKDFIAFCLQPKERMRTPFTYAIGSRFSQGINENLQALAANAFGLINDSITAGAFQMAAWEITSETGRAYDINDGSFAIVASNRKSNAAELLAQGWLDNIQNLDWTAPSKGNYILRADGTQDLLTDLPEAPLSASGLFLLSGLVGAGAVARRKRKVA